MRGVSINVTLKSLEIKFLPGIRAYEPQIHKIQYSSRATRLAVAGGMQALDFVVYIKYVPSQLRNLDFYTLLPPRHVYSRYMN